MKEIPLTHGKVALVDDEDYEWLGQHRWTFVATGNGYARRWDSAGKRRVYMHREILGFPIGYDIDHADRNTLNNQRSNLRMATKSQNNANRPKPNGAEGFKGVYWYKPYENWRADIKVRGRHIFLGYFDNPVDAARTYDSAARQHFGQFAFTNFPAPE